MDTFTMYKDKPGRTRRFSTGFTLIELLLVTILMAVMISLAAPNFRQFVDNNRVSSATDRLFHDLLLTRSEAVRRERNVVMCKSSDGTTCTTDAGWDQGWIVFEDDGDGTIDADDVIAVYEGPTGVSMIGDANVANTITYQATGRITLNGEICIADQTRNELALILNTAGRPRLDKDEDCGVPDS